jgi:hypothetical protein
MSITIFTNIRHFISSGLVMDCPVGPQLPLGCLQTGDITAVMGLDHIIRKIEPRAFWAVSYLSFI